MMNTTNAKNLRLRLEKKTKIWLLIISFLNLFGGVFATDISDLDLRGSEAVILDRPYHYQLLENQLPAKWKHKFLLNGKAVQTPEKELELIFTQTGTHLLEVLLQTEDQDFLLKKKIQAYQNQILYIGEESDFFILWFEKKLNDVGTLLSKIPPSKSDNSDQTFENQTLLNAQILIINEKNFQPYLEKYIALKQASISSLSKKIILVSDANSNLLKRSLAQYANTLANDEITLITSQHLINLFADLSLGKTAYSYGTSFVRSLEEGSSRMPFSYLVDELLKSGFPMRVLGILLSLSIVALVIAFLRQVIGLSVFGVYRPLFFALTGHLLGLKLTLALLLIAGVSNVFVNLFSKRVYLLQSSKVSLAVCTFLILFLVGFHRADQRDIKIFSEKQTEILIVFPFILMLIIAEKLIPSLHFRKKSWRIGLLELLIIGGISYGILQRQVVNDVFLSYPDLLLIVLLANIIIGRFSGLQLLELFRFMPLLKKGFDQEEE